MSSEANEKLILAVPKGRILKEAAPLFARAGIEPEPAFADPGARQLRFATSVPGIDIVRTRAFDVATYVAFGAAHVGVAGNDVLMEFDYDEIYAPLDLGIGKCRVSVAAPEAVAVVAARPPTCRPARSRLSWCTAACSRSSSRTGRAPRSTSAASRSTRRR